MTAHHGGVRVISMARDHSMMMYEDKEVNTMMDMSSLVDASLVFGGVVAMGIWAWSTLLSESHHAFAAQNPRGEARIGEHDQTLDKAA